MIFYIMLITCFVGLLATFAYIYIFFNMDGKEVCSIMDNETLTNRINFVSKMMKNNEEFGEFVKKYAIKHNLSTEEASTHQMVYDTAVYYSQKNPSL